MRRRNAACKARWIAPNDAAGQLRLAREAYARDPAAALARVRYHAPGANGLLPIWSRVERIGAPCRVGGELGRWYEDSALAGLRRVGTSDEIGVTDHRGWYMDPRGAGETVRGVVYQLPARNGRARYLAGYDDPFGNGGAFLACELFEDDDHEAAKREAAQRGGAIAERMAADERERAEAYEAGAAARELAREAHEAGKAWVATLRKLRQHLKTRHALGMFGVTSDETRRVIRSYVNAARGNCISYQDALEKAREAREDIGAWAWRKHGDAIREGYDNA